MYALKTITVTPKGRQVELVRALGDWYSLEFKPSEIESDVVARIEYSCGTSTPCIEIHKSDEAYITTMKGETVRHVCRGDAAERKRIAEVNRSASSISSTICVYSAD